jgi:hypothetical protein
MMDFKQNAMGKMLDRGEHKSIEELAGSAEALKNLQKRTEERFEKEARTMKTPIVIYHKNCVDGFSAAWVFHNAQDKMEQTFEFYAANYGDPIPDVEDRHVYLVDFSFKKDAAGLLSQ